MVFYPKCVLKDDLMQSSSIDLQPLGISSLLTSRFLPLPEDSLILHSTSFLLEKALNIPWSKQRIQIQNQECLPGYHPGSSLYHLYHWAYSEAPELMWSLLPRVLKALGEAKSESCIPGGKAASPHSPPPSHRDKHAAESKNLRHDFVC